MGRARRLDVREELRSVIQTEADALLRTARAVDGAYTRAVELMRRCRGKIVVTGVGKSGLIAQKIAATLASTGTPALYLHPGDAMHGSLGTLQKQDLVLAIGKSGESEELNALLPSLRKIGVKLIALVSRAGSTLARGADLILALPIRREACPLNLAPTSSTTAALAVGDALAITLMKLRAFQPAHFALLHPGGTLGRRLTLRVSDLMRQGPDHPAVRADDTVQNLIVEMTRKHCGAANVVDGRGRLVGLVTDHDIRRAIGSGRDWLHGSIASVMNPRPTTVHPETMACDAGLMMSSPRKPFNVLPVVDRRTRRAVGMIRLHEIRAQGL